MGDRLPTLAPSKSTVAGAIQQRKRQESFGLRALDLAEDSLGDGMPQMSQAVRGSMAAIIDSGIEQALRAVQQAAAVDANATTAASRWIIRALGVGMISLAFAVVGVLGWSLDAKVDRTATGLAAAQVQLGELNERSKALESNVKILAAHAVALTGQLNKTVLSNYELLDVLVGKLGARGDVPKSHERPATIEVPVTLRYVAGER